MAKKTLLWGMLFMGLVLVPALAGAQGGRIQVGSLMIVPSIKLQAMHDDNIFLGNGSPAVDEPEISDWIYHIMPGITLTYDLRERGSVSLGYQGDFARYDERSENDWRNHTGFLTADYISPGGLILGINNTYTDAEDPYGSESEFGLGEPQTKRWYNDLKTQVGYDFGARTRVFGYFNYYKQDYDARADFTQDYETTELGAGLQMRVMPKTWAFLRYYFGKQDYFSHPSGFGVTEANDADRDWHRVNLGLTWDSGAKLSGEINFGYQWNAFDNTIDVAGNRYEDQDIWIAETAVGYAAGPNTLLSLSVLRALRTTGADKNEFFEDTALNLSLQQVLLARLTLTLGAGYGLNDYNEPQDKKREDDNYSANIALDYQVREWLGVGAGYTYKKKESNYDENDYTDNQFLFSVGLIY